MRPLKGCYRLTNHPVGPTAVVKALVVRLGVGEQQGWPQSSYASRNDRSNHWALHPHFQAQFKLKSPCKHRHHEGMMQSMVREHGKELTRIAIAA